MIGGRGCQALGPLCVLASSLCGLASVGLAQRLPAARSPPPS
jgi:hypothetical protein